MTPFTDVTYKPMPELPKAMSVEEVNAAIVDAGKKGILSNPKYPKPMNETPNSLEVLKQELEATMKKIESLTLSIVVEKEQARRLLKAIKHLEG